MPRKTKKKNQQKSEFEITILPDGLIRFSRPDKSDAPLLCSFLSGVTSEEKIESLEEFFSSSDNIDIIFGEESLCG